MSLKYEFSENHELIITVGDSFGFIDHKSFFEIIKQITHNISSIILDFQRTTFIDYSALGMILILRDLTIEQQKKLNVINLQPEIKFLLKAVELDKILNI